VEQSGQYRGHRVGHSETTGCDGCQDAGASSHEQLSSDGYIEFTVGELNTMWMAGLSHGDDDTTYADIDFGFRFNGGGSADVLENGMYAGGDTIYAVGESSGFRLPTDGSSTARTATI
jgi:hypothetical protein